MKVSGPIFLNEIHYVIITPLLALTIFENVGMKNLESSISKVTRDSPQNILHSENGLPSNKQRINKIL